MFYQFSFILEVMLLKVLKAFAYMGCTYWSDWYNSNLIVWKKKERVGNPYLLKYKHILKDNQTNVYFNQVPLKSNNSKFDHSKLFRL